MPIWLFKLSSKERHFDDRVVFRWRSNCECGRVRAFKKKTGEDRREATQAKKAIVNYSKLQPLSHFAESPRDNLSIY